jgi:hypothetical protein
VDKIRLYLFNNAAHLASPAVRVKRT